MDFKLSLEPYLAANARVARVRATMVTRLAYYLPRGCCISQPAKVIILGKVGYGVAAVSAPRLEGVTANPSANNMAIQVAINDIARSISGCSRRDVKIQDLLANAENFNYTP